MIVRFFPILHSVNSTDQACREVLLHFIRDHINMWNAWENDPCCLTLHKILWKCKISQKIRGPLRNLRNSAKCFTRCAAQRQLIDEQKRINRRFERGWPKADGL